MNQLIKLVLRFTFKVTEEHNIQIVFNNPAKLQQLLAKNG